LGKSKRLRGHRETLAQATAVAPIASCLGVLPAIEPPRRPVLRRPGQRRPGDSRHRQETRCRLKGRRRFRRRSQRRGYERIDSLDSFSCAGSDGSSNSGGIANARPSDRVVLRSLAQHRHHANTRPFWLSSSAVTGPIRHGVRWLSEGDQGMGVLWWGFNSFVCVVGGLWVLSIGLWWGALAIPAGLAGIPIIASKARAGNGL
jgi:hypothetical protein